MYCLVKLMSSVSDDIFYFYYTYSAKLLYYQRNKCNFKKYNNGFFFISYCVRKGFYDEKAC